MEQNITPGEASKPRSDGSSPGTRIQFELCAETMQACLVARDGGADRIELCSALSEGGLTPSHALIREAVRKSHLPVYPILRPRGGNFVYTDSEFDLMAGDLRNSLQLGVSGFVIGLLTEAGSIDLERTKRLVALAGPLEVTFHRAFDCAKDLPQALEDVISTGCERLLSSGGAPNVLEGAAMLAHLVAQSAGRLRVAVGGGLRLQSAGAVARTTRATAFHGSMRRPSASAYACLPGEIACCTWSVDPEDIRQMIRALGDSQNP
jgi:copper homeostasis protein